jgi:hypothetical protein
MTIGHVAVPARWGRRWRRWLLLASVLALGAAAAVRLAHRATSHTAAPVSPYLCTYEYEPAPPPELPPVPAIDPAVWDNLERCLAAEPVGPPHRPAVTVADIRHWIEVERDPAWLEAGAWWLPMSGEGQPGFPSGYYRAVPVDGAAPCRGAIVN